MTPPWAAVVEPRNFGNDCGETRRATTMPEHRATISQVHASRSPTDQAWDEALSRVEGYLRAHHLESRWLLTQLAATIIAEARAGAPRRAAEEPVAIAMRVTHARIGAWLARAGDESGWAHERDRAHGRLALVIANLPGRWSDYFLSAEPVPRELAAAMASFQFQPGPELRFSNMPPAPLEFGFDEAGDPQAGRHGAWLLVRAASSWLIVVGLIGVAWAASH